MNILNLCLTTHPSIISTCKPIQGLSDHDAVLIKLFFPTSHKNHPPKILPCTNADWDIIPMDISEEYCIFNLMIPLPEASTKIGTFFIIISQKL